MQNYIVIQTSKHKGFFIAFRGRIEKVVIKILKVISLIKIER